MCCLCSTHMRMSVWCVHHCITVTISGTQRDHSFQLEFYTLPFLSSHSTMRAICLISSPSSIIVILHTSSCTSLFPFHPLPLPLSPPSLPSLNAALQDIRARDEHILFGPLHCQKNTNQRFCDSICMSVMYIYLMTFDVGVSVDVNIYILPHTCTCIRM